MRNIEERMPRRRAAQHPCQLYTALFLRTLVHLPGSRFSISRSDAETAWQQVPALQAMGRTQPSVLWQKNDDGALRTTAIAISLVTKSQIFALLLPFPTLALWLAAGLTWTASLPSSTSSSDEPPSSFSLPSVKRSLDTLFPVLDVFFTNPECAWLYLRVSAAFTLAGT
eukprot:CAMPEP_0181226818 /NCGR_PEP_ID=MMETSP1096-20121128/32456_1 /TAXON_ID=156174 ORGANISM="Chrysochromulina ericina, Strain CCMP281" /NCGR_SAMPLE_ID=MMETSP1096 /ASSEMBLY_ACC=CAM_ASM_000453 /LENGTH=168 /DNA_ID=CAMNT_0023320179 /DNA_START=460 /DNA_END=966 /DNA_ORIENTATION=-